MSHNLYEYQTNWGDQVQLLVYGYNWHVHKKVGTTFFCLVCGWILPGQEDIAAFTEAGELQIEVLAQNQMSPKVLKG